MINLLSGRWMIYILNFPYQFNRLNTNQFKTYRYYIDYSLYDYVYVSRAPVNYQVIYCKRNVITIRETIEFLLVNSNYFSPTYRSTVTRQNELYRQETCCEVRHVKSLCDSHTRYALSATDNRRTRYQLFG